MKQETNNEMDLLLRRLARRQDEAASNHDDLLDHLDADELNAYAENALPSAARARYTQHIAECGRCRELVVSLSGAAGVVIAPETIKAAEPSGFRKFLAGLFSPMVLQYAAPALGLIGIVVIGLVLLNRPESNTDFVVQVPRESPAQAPASGPAPAPSGDVFSYNNSNTAGGKNDAAPKEEAQKKSGEQQAPVPNAPPTVSIDAQVREDAAASGAAAPPVTQPAPQESPAAPKTADSVKSKTEAEAQKDDAGRVTITANEAPPQPEKKELEISRRQVSGLTAADAEKSRSRGIAGSVQSARPSPAQRDGTDSDNNYVETRSVAGRRFRKEGGVWIDTAYNSSRTTTTLARNSEQFRALVADEPEINTIADQLNGEIIVVWKGRPYRIR